MGAELDISYQKGERIELSIRDVPTEVFDKLAKKYVFIKDVIAWVSSNHISITLAENVVVTYWKEKP